MSQKLSLKDLPIKDKKILMRVDFNVPIDKDGKISDPTRIQAALPSIRYIIEKEGAVILMSHLGRPKGKFDSKYSLKPCAEELSRLLGKTVKMAPDCVGSEVEKLAKELKPKEVLLLENLRFHAAEENPSLDPSFAKSLAALADFYVDDAFGTAHRAHSSTVEITKYMQGKAAAGFLLEKEIKFLGDMLFSPAKPFVAIIGGSKISTKIGVLKALLQKVDVLLIGGGMAYTFFKAEGYQIGKSICEEQLIPKAKEILKLAIQKKVKVILPVDTVIVSEISENTPSQTVEIKEGIPHDQQGVDIGPKTIEIFNQEIQKAKTILWNGPVGVFEVKPFSKGTLAVAHAVASSPAVTIAGGGETIAAIQESGFADKISHLSTGGGAALEFIEFSTLPGIEALSNIQ